MLLPCVQARWLVQPPAPLLMQPPHLQQAAAAAPAEPQAEQPVVPTRFGRLRARLAAAGASLRARLSRAACLSCPAVAE